MKEFIITRNEAGQRADKLLAKYLKEAPKSFLYKMMRKKNITLNGKKIQGNEQLSEGDVLRLFLAEETDTKISGGGECRESTGTQFIAPNAAESAKAEAGYHL